MTAPARLTRRAGKAGRRWLLLVHRWLGIATGPLFALWIGSGLVMLYVPFPALSPAGRLALLPPIAWDRVQVDPDTAYAVAAPGGLPAFSLDMRGADPVYRFVAPDGARTTISAATGARLGPVDEGEAVRIAGGGVAEAVWRDQWTVTARYDPMRPFFKVARADPAGTETYVSAPTGEIALVTTRRERGWNWLGAVTHWIYLTPLRVRPEAWRQAVLWLSGFACLTAFSGLAVGIWRLRLRTRYRDGAVSPYRGLPLWHHGFGLLGGVGLVSFIVSGWLSMNPNQWFSSPSPPDTIRMAYAGRPGRIGLAAGDLERFAGIGLRSMRFASVGGAWRVICDEADGPRAISLDAAPARAAPRDPGRSRLPDAGPGDRGTAGAHPPGHAPRCPAALKCSPEDETLLDAAADAVPGGRLVAIDRLTAYDAYWYPHGGERPLPVLRLVYDDATATWLHIAPRDGTILTRLDRSGRANRWLFDASHRLDLPMLTTCPSGRDLAQWSLNLLAAGIAFTGIVAGWRRLRR